MNEVIEAYKNKFGGFPYFLFLCADSDKIIEAVEKALETGEEISIDKNDNY